jgi:predicted transcriptional regulator
MAVLTKQVKVMLSDEQYNRLKRIANKRKESLASVIRDALDSIDSNIQIKDGTMGKHEKELRDYEFFGMWRDRDDMKDSVEWVRKQRENWDRRIIDGKENDNY